MSLSQEPAFSALKENFVCGVRDITDEPYCGLSGRHETAGNAVRTTNGAGPHNVQLFMLSADGTVLHCLPGYWNANDLVEEMKFAEGLNQVWTNPHLTTAQKKQKFKELQLAHVEQHSPAMVKRSKMQGFDQQYEAKHRWATSDTIANRNLITSDMLEKGGPKLPQEAFKTTDRIMHERMATRPFLPISRFDVANYVEYGKPKYDKKEDARNADGSVNMEMAKGLPTLGSKEKVAEEQAMKDKRMRMRMNRMARAKRSGSSFTASGTDTGAGSPYNRTYYAHYATTSKGNAQNSVKNYGN
ncbi:MAG: hypothetical protein JSS86_16985 [Cyanobacteria bacterium SZAS LIN-2]|nr:hypothetical protein [Cyanobacteria bacterium SZAS LIN-3]MBS1998023.1 hypothetical protein [Cyanobacteria bacterium SZAS LIN-2]MBS2005702.1 hypothetical protein [Cyanobacteria bacterium SZAS TMP-1]